MTKFESIKSMSLIESKIYNEKHTQKYKTLHDCEDILIVDDEETKQRFFVHKHKGILLREGLWLNIVQDYRVPVYDNEKIHFKDVCKRLIRNASDSSSLDFTLKNKLKKKWDNKYKAVSKQSYIGIVDKVIAGKIISKWVKFAKENRMKREYEKVEEEVKTKSDPRSSLPNIRSSKEVFHQTTLERIAREIEGGSINEEQDSSFKLYPLTSNVYISSRQDQKQNNSQEIQSLAKVEESKKKKILPKALKTSKILPKFSALKLKQNLEEEKKNIESSNSTEEHKEKPNIAYTNPVKFTNNAVESLSTQKHGNKISFYSTESYHIDPKALEELESHIDEAEEIVLQEQPRKPKPRSPKRQRRD